MITKVTLLNQQCAITQIKMKSLLTIYLLSIANLLFAQPDSAHFYFKKGMDEKTARRYLVSSDYLDKAIKFDPTYLDAYIENGRVNLEMRKIDAAQGNFTKAYTLQPTNSVAIKELSSLYFNNRQFLKAINLAQKCISCPDAERIIALSYYNLEDYGKAISGLNKVLSKDPKDAEATYFLGKSYLELEDYKNATPQFQKAVILDPTKSLWMYELGLIYYNKGDFQSALKYFKQAETAGYIKSNDFYENTGFSYLNTGDVENGMKYLQTVLSRKPRDKELLTDVAYSLYKANKWDDALVYYQKLLELDAKDANALYMAGMTFQKKGNKERGQQMCDEAIKLDPSLAKNRQKKGGDNFGL